MKDVLFRVTRPEGVQWASRYKTEDAAWSHLLGVKRLFNTKSNRARMRHEGWKVTKVPEARDGSA